MTTVDFGGPGGSAETGFFPLTSTPISLATGRAMANGDNRCVMYNLAVLVGGNGATRTGTASLAGGSMAFTAANGSPTMHDEDLSAQILFSGGTGTLSISASGSLNFGRTGSGTTTDGHTAFGGIVGGSYAYVQAPTAMTKPTLTAASGHLTVTFTAPSDDGDGTISGYVIQYSTDPTFSSTATATATSSPVTVAVTNGMYYVRVSSKNECTTKAGTYAAWSPVATQRVGVGGARWDATAGAEVPYTVAVRWDSTAVAEVPITVARRWDAINNVEVDL